jgi:hypothetical protein
MFTYGTIIRTSTKQRRRNKMDLTIYMQMPDLPNADIMFISELEDMVGYELEGYEAEENMHIAQELEDEQESEAQYQRDLREFKLSRIPR